MLSGNTSYGTKKPNTVAKRNKIRKGISVKHIFSLLLVLCYITVTGYVLAEEDYVKVEPPSIGKADARAEVKEKLKEDSASLEKEITKLAEAKNHFQAGLDIVTRGDYYNALRELKLAVTIASDELTYKEVLDLVQKQYNKLSKWSQLQTRGRSMVEDGQCKELKGEELSKFKSLLERSHKDDSGFGGSVRRTGRKTKKEGRELIEKGKMSLSKAENLKKDQEENCRSEGDEFFNKKNYELALVYYSFVSKINPQDQNVKRRIYQVSAALALAMNYQDRGIKYSKEKLYHRAKAAYDKSLEIWPFSREVPTLLVNVEQIIELADGHKAEGLRHFGNKNYPQAIKEFKQAIAICPEYETLQAEIDRAEKFMKQAEKVEKEGDRYIEKGDLTSAIINYEESVEVYPYNKAVKTKLLKAYRADMPAQLKKINGYISQKLYGEAKTVTQKILKVGVSNSEVADKLRFVQKVLGQVNQLKRKGDEYLGKKELVKALEAYEKALELYPNFDSAEEGKRNCIRLLKATEKLKEEALAYMDKKRYEEAISLFQKYLSLYPEQSDVQVKLDEAEILQNIRQNISQAEKLIKGGDYQSAIEKCQEVLKIDKENPKALQLMVYAEMEIIRLKEIKTTISGGAWVVKGGGQSDILRGLDIALLEPNKQMRLKIRLLRKESLEKYSNQYAELSSDIRDISTIVAPYVIKRVKTNIDGKYEIKDVQGGKYFLYSCYKTSFSVAYWFIPVKIGSNEPIEIDFENSNMTELYNKESD